MLHITNGDTAAALMQGEEPLLRRADHAAGLLPADPVALVLTEREEEVREGAADWIRLRGGIDWWHGGVHLHGPDAAWRWDADAERLVSA